MPTPPTADLAARLARLEARISDQEQTIQQLQGRLATSRRPRLASSLLLLCALVLGISFASFSVSQAQQPTQADAAKKAPETAPLGAASADPAKSGNPQLQTTGNPLLIGNTNLPTVISDTTALINPSFSLLARRMMNVSNYTTSNITSQFDTSSYRVGIIGGTSGTDSTAGNESAYRVGVLGASDTGDGMYGYSAGDGNGVKAHSEGALGNGVLATAPGSLGYAVWGIGGAYGGAFEGARAPLWLVPSTSFGAPTSGFHQRGEFYVDNTGNLYFCTGAGSPGMWVQLNLRASFIPTLTR